MLEPRLAGESRLSEPIEQLLRLIYKTPKEYWPNLLQMIRLFRESVTRMPIVFCAIIVLVFHRPEMRQFFRAA